MEQPIINARVKQVIEVDGLKFKDSDGDGQLTPYEDWRLSPAERAADLVSRMDVDELLGLLLINSKPMGLSQKDKSKTSHDGVLDESNDPDRSGDPIPPTTELIEQRHVRHFIIREYPTGEELAKWTNALNEVAEGTRWGVPVIVAANPRNERGSQKIMPLPEEKDFTQFPGSLGMAAARDLDLISQWAEIGRREFLATGLRKGYMYMADVVTDPRWFRINATLGEDPEFVSQAISRIVEGYQGEELGPESIALTTKHFPGGGARENGFDPHYAEGKFNVYPTPNSLEKYHLPPFQAAIDVGTSSIMPYYAIPSEEKSTRPQPPFETGEPFEQVGFAFNEQVLDQLRAMGHAGYINSDTGILTDTAWGVEDLDHAERVAKAINAGTDIIAGSFEVSWFRDAYDRGLLAKERIDEAARLLLTELFALGLFENPYRDPAAADDIVDAPEHREVARLAHRKSVVLLKNNGTLPLSVEGLAGKRVYVDLLEADMKVSALDAFSAQVAEQLPGVEFTTDPAFADVGLVFLKPFAGAYFESVGLLDLNINEGSGIDLARLGRIRDAVDALVVSVNLFLPWLLTNVEPLADVLLAGFETDADAVVDVAFGRFAPTGELPISLPGSDEAIAVDENGICASPNDVPGFAKEEYMDGRPYIYVDEHGNRYQLGHGLTYGNDG